MPFPQLPAVAKLQDRVFCLTEERNYFETKYLEQVSELASLKADLLRARKEVARLRTELVEGRSSAGGSAEHEYAKAADAPSTPDTTRTSVTDERSAGHSYRRHPGEDDDDDEEEEAQDIRQSAEKLLQWAQYRTRPSSMSISSDIPRVIGSALGGEEDDSTSSEEDEEEDLLSTENLNDRLEAAVL